MTEQSVECGFPWIGLRNLPTSYVGTFAKMLQESGCVDYITMSDLMGPYFPRSLWDPETIELARTIPDLDSYPDPLVQLGYASAAAPDLGLIYGGTNTLRTGPAEVMRSAYTLATASQSNKRAIVTLGVGEALNATPFGYKRSEGLKRFEDHFRLYKLLRESDEPFDFDGHFWHYRQAYIGTVRDGDPRMFAQGAGPKALQIAAKYADGLCTIVPMAIFTPDDLADLVKQIRGMVEAEGRDPEAFGIMAYFYCFVTDDPDDIRRACDMPMIRAMTATCGRLNQRDWYRSGLNPVMPDDWNYSLHYLPWTMSAAEAQAMVDRVTPEMVTNGMISGSPKEVASILQEYVDAGVQIAVPYDLYTLFGGPDSAPTSLARQLEVLRLLKTG